MQVSHCQFLNAVSDTVLWEQAAKGVMHLLTCLNPAKSMQSIPMLVIAAALLDVARWIACMMASSCLAGVGKQATAVVNDSFFRPCSS